MKPKTELEVTVLRQVGSLLEDVTPDMAELVRSAVSAAASAAGYDGKWTEIGVLLTDDPGIAEYHKQYLGDDSPTDVISFASTETQDEPSVNGGPGDSHLGDIVVSTDTARTQAQQYGHSTEMEISLLVIHGFLHLVGFDDCDEGSRARMREAEARALSLL